MVAPSSAAFGLTIPFYWDTRKSIAELYLPLVADGLATGSDMDFLRQSCLALRFEIRPIQGASAPSGPANPIRLPTTPIRYEFSDS